MMAQQELMIEPIDDAQIQPASVDIRLGNHYLKIDENAIESISLDTPAQYVEFEADEVIIPPNSFLLATTREYIKLPNDLTAFVEGEVRSVEWDYLFKMQDGWTRALKGDHARVVQCKPFAHSPHLRAKNCTTRICSHGPECSVSI